MDLRQAGEGYRIPSRLSLVQGRYSTCDTCHTRHVPTDQRAYVLLPFEQSNDLCDQCHRGR